VAAYAGLRTAGCGLNYLIAGSDACPGLVNVAAIRSTGLSASLGIAEHAIGIVASLGVKLGPVRPLSRGRAPAADGPWWLRTAAFRESRDGAPPAPGRA
jgi:glycerol-3-phosphate dehydrogenase